MWRRWSSGRTWRWPRRTFGRRARITTAVPAPGLAMPVDGRHGTQPRGDGDGGENEDGHDHGGGGSGARRVPDDVRTGPAREVARLLAAKLDGVDLSANEAAALARELRQTLAALAATGSSADGWGTLLADLGDAE